MRTIEAFPLFRTAPPRQATPEQPAKQAALTASTWAGMSWADKLMHCSADLGITYERLDDGRIWLSRWDDALVREALALFRRIDGELKVTP